MKTTKQNHKIAESNLQRRDFLRRALFGAGALGLRSLATGLPIGLLANPTGAKANEVEPTGRILILAAEQAGSPLNANVPGTYGVPDIDVYHAPFEGMAETSLTLGGNPYTAAKPWADLPQTLALVTVFLGHRVIHVRGGRTPLWFPVAWCSRAELDAFLDEGERRSRRAT